VHTEYHRLGRTKPRIAQFQNIAGRAKRATLELRYFAAPYAPQGEHRRAARRRGIVADSKTAARARRPTPGELVERTDRGQEQHERRQHETGVACKRRQQRQRRDHERKPQRTHLSPATPGPAHEYTTLAASTMRGANQAAPLVELHDWSRLAVAPNCHATLASLQSDSISNPPHAPCTCARSCTDSAQERTRVRVERAHDARVRRATVVGSSADRLFSTRAFLAWQ
jgi:hypothetical protein